MDFREVHTAPRAGRSTAQWHARAVSAMSVRDGSTQDEDVIAAPSVTNRFGTSSVGTPHASTRLGFSATKWSARSSGPSRRPPGSHSPARRPDAGRTRSSGLHHSLSTRSAKRLTCVAAAPCASVAGKMRSLSATTVASWWLDSVVGCQASHADSSRRPPVAWLAEPAHRPGRLPTRAVALSVGAAQRPPRRLRTDTGPAGCRCWDRSS